MQIINLEDFSSLIPCKLCLLLTGLSIVFLTPLMAQMSYGKEFDALLVKADSLYNKKEYEEAGKYFDKALDLKNGKYPDSGSYKDGFVAWARAKNVDKALFYLKRLAQEGWIENKDLEKLKKDSLYQILRNDEKWDQILQIHMMKHQQYGIIADSLETVYKEDQALRQIINCAQEKFAKDSISLNYFNQLIESQDSANLAFVKSVIQKYGWLGISKIGDKANRTLWLVIQHSPLEIQEKYLVIIKASVDKGETRASSYAFLQDRILMRRGEKQLYGTQVIEITETGENKVYPIQDPSNVDKRRAEIGFEPIEEYLKSMNVIVKDIKDLDDPVVLEYWKKLIGTKF